MVWMVSMVDGGNFGIMEWSCKYCWTKIRKPYSPQRLVKISNWWNAMMDFLFRNPKDGFNRVCIFWTASSYLDLFFWKLLIGSWIFQVCTEVSSFFTQQNIMRHFEIHTPVKRTWLAVKSPSSLGNTNLSNLLKWCKFSWPCFSSLRWVTSDPYLYK